MSNPDYSMLKVFRCACYPCLRPYNKNKLEFRTSECTFLGHFTSHKGYKCLAKDGCLYISKDVQLNEHDFPFAKENNNSQVSPAPTSHTSLIPLTVVFTHSTPLSQSNTGATPVSHSNPSPIDRVSPPLSGQAIPSSHSSSSIHLDRDS